MSETLQPSAHSRPITALLETLEQQQQAAPENRRGLSQELSELMAANRANPAVENDDLFNTRVAWLVQDWERHSGTDQAPAISGLIARGLDSYARELPGLVNLEMKSHLSQASEFSDRRVVADIRTQALTMASMPPSEQNGMAGARLLGRLEGRLEQYGQGQAVIMDHEERGLGQRDASKSVDHAGPSQPEPDPDLVESRESAPSASSSPATETVEHHEEEAAVHPAPDDLPAHEPREATDEAERIRLEVLPEQKEEAEMAGARQDRETGEWSIAPDADPALYKRWLPGDASQKAEDVVRAEDESASRDAQSEEPEPQAQQPSETAAQSKAAEPEVKPKAAPQDQPQVAAGPAAAQHAGLGFGAAVGNLAC